MRIVNLHMLEEIKLYIYMIYFDVSYFLHHNIKTKLFKSFLSFIKIFKCMIQKCIVVCCNLTSHTQYANYSTTLSSVSRGRVH